MSISIRVDGVSKSYRKYDERNQSLKAAVLRGRRARYEEFAALQDISFEVPKGSIFGLIGDNGSGKSTLLKCIAGILTPEAGRIAVDGSMAALLELGAGFHPELSGRENVFLNAAILGMTKRQTEDRFDEIVAFSGLEDFIDAPVRTYSSGMYVRLGFAVAVHTDPDILLLDEILAVGDEDFQRKCMEKISGIHSAGKTIVIVSHAVSTVARLCESAILLEHGRIVRQGNADEVVDAYLEEAHESIPDDGDHGKRWGSGEARIESLVINGHEGTSATTAVSGEPIAFRFYCSSSVHIELPTLGLGVFSIDGVYLSGVGLKPNGSIFPVLDGKAIVDLELDRLDLVPGAYLLSANLLDQHAVHTYDAREKFLRVDLVPSDQTDNSDRLFEAGPLRLGGHWRAISQ